MTVSLQRTLKDAGATAAAQLTAPAIDADGTGVPTSLAGTTWSQSFSSTTYYGVGEFAPLHTTNQGFRKAFSSNKDLTDRQFIQWRVVLAANMGFGDSVKTWANGGSVLMVFYDGSGNWAGYKIAGSDDKWQFSNEGSGAFLGTGEGAFQAPTSLDSTNVAFFHLDRTRTPDYSSASPIDWASVAGTEMHFRPISTGGGMRIHVLLGQLYTVDNPLVVGSGGLTTATTDLRSQIASQQGIGNYCHCFNGVSTYQMFGGAPSAAFYTAIGFQVGNGGTNTTTGTLAAGTLAFINPPEDTNDAASPRYYGIGGYVQPGTTSRLVDVYQGASDNVTFNDQSWASSRAWGVRVRGTAGLAAFNRCIFTRPSQFECAHGVFTDCLWDAPTAPVEVTTDTEIVRGVIRNGTHGLQIVGGPGNYAGIDTSLGGASVYDIQLGSGGAGTYILGNITATATLAIHNDSATDAVVLELPAGIVYTTSTAGGTLTIQTPSLYQEVTINGLVTGSRVQIYDTTNDEELTNEVASGASVTWTDTDPAVGSRDIRVRIAYVSGDTAKEFIEADIGTCGTGEDTAVVTYLANQVDDDVYNTNAIDGSAVSGITIDDSTDRVTINIGGGAVTWPEIYAYQVYWLGTEAGIVDDGAFIEAPDTANYLLTGFKVKNTSATALTITGGYGRDASTGTVLEIIDTTGGFIFPAPDHVVAFATGSGLTAGEQAQLAQAANAGNLTFNGDAVNANIVQVNDAEITGAGTADSPWGP